MDYKVKLKSLNSSCLLTNAPNDSLGLVISAVSQNFSKNDKIFIVENDHELETFYQQLVFFNPAQKIIKFYGYDTMPYDKASPKPQILANRIKNLYQINQRNINKKYDENYLILTTINNFKQKIINPQNLKNLGIKLHVKSQYSLQDIVSFLIDNGYVRQSCANNVGEFAVRGGIIDIVMQQAGDIIGYRLDFFGLEIESIKIFNPITQISEEHVKSFEILPTCEILLNQNSLETFRQKYRKFFLNGHDDHYYQAVIGKRTFHGIENWLPLFYENDLVSIVDYLQQPVIFLASKIINLDLQRDKIINEYYHERLTEKKHKSSEYIAALPCENLYFNHQWLMELLSNSTYFELHDKSLDSAKNQYQRTIDLEFKSVPDFVVAAKANKKDPLILLQEYLHNYQHQKAVIAVLNEGFKDRLLKILHDYNFTIDLIKNFSDFNHLKTGKIALTILPCEFGFSNSDFIIIGEQALFGEKIMRQKISKSAGERIIEESLSINLGDLIVHRDHGIGKFDGIQTINALGVKTDMIKIIYAQNDNLFVPVDNINLISRYGDENSLVQLDRLGGANWKNRRDKIRQKIKVSAQELINVAAQRQIAKANIYEIENHFYHEFKARFNFVETNDQLQAIHDVENDLQKGIYMDRLICGDVGFGKTEVALRASAIVAQKSQVAVVAPTTILVRQHYRNFCQRFANSEIKIAQLSRLISTKEAKKIHEDLANGKIDIVIGTHALLQKNVKFHNLGLLIIDEEQHFGVAQKEQIKKLRSNIHVLTLSATPIPRTLQMSLTGVKDLSIIATAPVDRIAVRNFVMPFDAVIVKEAIMREFNRSGKTFFVVPRVRDIEEMEARLKNLLPELKITHAHGQMSPTELENIMNDFIDGKIDVLLSTTIIESGIDIASANTMIIYKAEMFGLAQLYQLRGRVGRGKIRGYCYFMLDHKHKLARDARKKIEVMQNLDALGVGFNIASFDMDIRGSGDILGDEQSGHIKETGAELYQQMLLETIEKLKNNKDHQMINDDFDNNVNVKLGISLLIPSDYMNDLSLRMSFYKKISHVKNPQDRENLINEMNDRFGKIPAEVINLFEVALIKNACLKIGVNNVEINNNGVLIGFKNNLFKGAQELTNLIFNSKNNIKLAKDHKVLFSHKFSDESSKINGINQILKLLNELIK